MWNKRKTTIGWILATLLLSVSPVSILGSEAEQPWRVLVLHSFGRDTPPFSGMARELKIELARIGPRPVEFTNASLEKQRFEDADEEGPLRDYLAAVFEQTPPDLLVAVGGPAMFFFHRNRDILFPNAPLLTVGVDKRRLSGLDFRDDETFVYAEVNLPRLILHVRSLFPKTKHLFFVSGDAAIDRFWENEARREWPAIAPDIQFHWMSDHSVFSLRNKLAELPPASAIFLSIFSQDAEGVSQIEQDMLKLIHPVANAPIFGFSSEQLGLGIVGGPLIDIREIGVQAAGVAARILAGERPEELRPLGVTESQPVYDWRELDRWGIRPHRLPPGSLVQYRPPSLWQNHRGAVIISLAALLIQFSLIGLLVVARKKAVESDASLQLTTQAANIGLWNYEEKRKPEILCNARWREIFGLDEKGYIKASDVLERIHPQDRQAVLAAVEKASAKGVTFEFEHRILLGKKKIRWVASRGFGELGKTRGITIDITKRKEAEVELNRHRSELAHLSRVNTLGGLSGAIAHEVNRPLAVILTNAEAGQSLLTQKPVKLEEVAEVLDAIIRASGRAASVIVRLRALLERRDVNHQKIDLNYSLDEVLAFLDSELKSNGVKLRRGGSTSPLFIKADRIQIQQVLLNLMTNAVDAMKEIPRESRHLTIETKVNGTDVIFRLIDSGPGIGMPVDRCFEPFFTTKPQGLGMGLAICRTILDAHGGRLDLNSVPGEGTVASVAFPRALPL